MISFNLSQEQTFSCSPNIGIKRVLSAVVDGAELFIMNVCRYPNDRYNLKYDMDKPKQVIQSFLESNGESLRFYGPESPQGLLSMMSLSGYTFERDCRKLKIKKSSSHDIYDVHGNLKEFSCAFRYRFYSREALDSWISQARLIDPGADYQFV